MLQAKQRLCYLYWRRWAVGKTFQLESVDAGHARSSIYLPPFFLSFLYLAWPCKDLFYSRNRLCKKTDASSVKKKNKNKNQLTTVWYPRVYLPWNIHHLQMLTQLKLRVMRDDHLWFYEFSLALFLFSTFSLFLLISALFKWPFLDMCVFFILSLNEWTGDSCVTFEMSRRPSVRSAPVNAKCLSTPPINLCRRCRYTHTAQCVCVSMASLLASPYTHSKAI